MSCCTNLFYACREISHTRRSLNTPRYNKRHCNSNNDVDGKRLKREGKSSSNARKDGGQFRQYSDLLQYCLACRYDCQERISLILLVTEFDRSEVQCCQKDDNWFSRPVSCSKLSSSSKSAKSNAGKKSGIGDFLSCARAKCWAQKYRQLQHAGDEMWYFHAASFTASKFHRQILHTPQILFNAQRFSKFNHGGKLEVLNEGIVFKNELTNICEMMLTASENPA